MECFAFLESIVDKKFMKEVNSCGNKSKFRKLIYETELWACDRYLGKYILA